MKILHVVDTLDPADGGPAVSVPSLAAAQATLGHTVAILYRKTTTMKSESSFSTDIPGMDRVILLSLHATNAALAAAAVFKKDRLHGLVRDHDIVHVHGIWRPLLLLSGFSALDLDIPFAIAPRGMLGGWSLGQKKLKKRLAMQLGWRSLLGQAGFIHVLNVSEKEEVDPLRLGCPVEVIPNGTFVETTHDLPVPAIFRTAFPALREQPYVLFLSRLHYVKGLDYLIEAFATLCKSDSTTHLVVAGPDAGQRTPMQKLVRQRELTDRVHFVGPIYGEMKRSALAGATCFCQPSRYEGFSMAILEALASGLPAVISHAVHFPEVKECGAGLVVDPASPELAHALSYYISNPGARDAARLAARDMVVSRFSWPAIARRSIDAYERLTLRSAVSGKDVVAGGN